MPAAPSGSAGLVEIDNPSGVVALKLKLVIPVTVKFPKVVRVVVQSLGLLCVTETGARELKQFQPFNPVPENATTVKGKPMS